MSKLIENMRSVSGFLNEALEAADKGGILEAIRDTAPWWGDAMVDSAAESIPIIKFIAKFAHKLTAITDADEQGYIACTLAYNDALKTVLLSRISELPEGFVAKEDSQLLEIGTVEMTGFTLDEGMVNHAFVVSAEDRLQNFLIHLGVDPADVPSFVLATRKAFQRSLRKVFYDEDTKDKFQNFLNKVKLSAYEKDEMALEAHMAYQSRQYGEMPLFKTEPFALRHVYTNTSCSVYTWSEIQKMRDRGTTHNDIFDVPMDERVDLSEIVSEYICDPQLWEPIIIQGEPGSGKSSFTLRLATELSEQSFRPIRIRFRDVSDFNEPLPDWLSHSICFSDPAETPTGNFPKLSADWFKDCIESEERINVGSGRSPKFVSPYVFIFDGWGEIHVGASQGFKDEINSVLKGIRRELLMKRAPNKPKMSVILTGRPTLDIAQTDLISAETPILTIQPMAPQDLRRYCDEMARYWKTPLLASKSQDCQAPVYAGREGLQDRVDRVSNIYEEALARGASASARASVLTVLGRPFLAYLGVRVAIEAKHPEELEEIFGDATNLYRILVDMTHRSEARADSSPPIGDMRGQLLGGNLRPLLWRCAEAITSIESEVISREDIIQRLDWTGETIESILEVFAAKSKLQSKENILARLILGFFFREGKWLGVEFVHASLREYLFAESVIERLKEYGRNLRVARAYEEDPENGLPERKDYRKDFQGDPRNALAHSLARIFATHWSSAEILEHIEKLIFWEVSRSRGDQVIRNSKHSTEPLDLPQWKFIRDAMADLWDWWAEGFHLRPRPTEKENGIGHTLTPPAVQEWTELCSVHEKYSSLSSDIPTMPRVTTVDARLGEVFFHLSAIIHSALLSDVPDKIVENQTARRRYQSRVRKGKSTIVRFAPSGDRPFYFRNYVSRINAAGWRPLGEFPSRASLSQTDLSRTRLERLCLVGANLNGAQLAQANLSGSDLSEAKLMNADLLQANLTGAILTRSNLSQARLTQAKLVQANLANSELPCARLTLANLSGAILTKVTMPRAFLAGACLTGADISGANLEHTSLAGAELVGANLTQASFERTLLSRALLVDANLTGARFSGADLTRADLTRATLTRTFLDDACLMDTNLHGVRNAESANFHGAEITGARLDRETTLSQSSEIE